MQENTKYDIFFLIDGGIGNVLECLYAVEYCIVNKKKTGLYIKNLSKSFVEFLRKSYGAHVVLGSLENLTTTNLIHSFTFYDNFDLEYDYYFYVQPDNLSTRYLSETEQYLSIVKALYPSEYASDTLQFLTEDYSDKVKRVEPERKVVLYPGCSAAFSSKKWPYFMELMNKVGVASTLLLGSTEDTNFNYSYFYPNWISKVVPQKILNWQSFYNVLKKLGLLQKHAHYKGMDKMENTFFNHFSWEELVAIFRRCWFFVGNDGGLMHLAACCGARGKAIFGPTSVEKNVPYSKAMEVVALNLDCQPCSLRATGINYAPGIIACPNQLTCLYSISVETIYRGIPSFRSNSGT